MENFIALAQIAVSLSVAYVWIFRFENVAKDFNQFGLSVTTRSFVGAAKTAIATLLFAGVWFPSLVLIPAILMSLFLVAAQYFHFKANNPFIKRLPSLVLLTLSALIAVLNYIE